MKIIDFAKYIGKLKQTKRIGWKNFKVPESESVAEHSFRVAVLAMVLAPKFKLDVEKVVKMAIVHDVGEAIVGDIVKQYGEKMIPNIKQIRKNEEKALKKIFSLINGTEYIKLYQEYEGMKTKESLFVKQIDRLEFMMQALEFEKTYKMKFPAEISKWVSSMIKDKSLKKILNEIETLRKKK